MDAFAKVSLKFNEVALYKTVIIDTHTCTRATETATNDSQNLQCFARSSLLLLSKILATASSLKIRRARPYATTGSGHCDFRGDVARARIQMPVSCLLIIDYLSIA